MGYKGFPLPADLSPSPLVSSDSELCPSQQAKFQSLSRIVIPFSQYNVPGFQLLNQLVNVRGRTITVIGPGQSTQFPPAVPCTQGVVCLHFTPFDPSQFMSLLSLDTNNITNSVLKIPPTDMVVQLGSLDVFTFECPFDQFYYSIIGGTGNNVAGPDQLIVVYPDESAQNYILG